MYGLVLALALVSGQPGYTGVVWVKSAACPACTAMEKSVDKLLSEGAPVMVVVVANQAELAPYDNHGLVPVTILYRDGKVVGRSVGYLADTQLRKMLTSVKKKE
jgi:hypothetical protein